jgi:hypothetical protein
VTGSVLCPKNVFLGSARLRALVAWDVTFMTLARVMVLRP